MSEIIVSIFLLIAFTILLVMFDSIHHSDLYRIKNKHGKLKKRLIYDDYCNIEDTLKQIKHWETEFNVEKPWYCFWINLRK